MTTHKVDFRDNSAGEVTLAVSPGDELDVWIKANPTTGYSWSISDEHSPKVNLKSSAYHPNEPIMCGSPGAYNYVIEVLEEVPERIDLVYERPWEKGKKLPAETVKVFLTRK